MRERAIMIGIRVIQERDCPERARIWRDVLDIPISDECLAETYGRMGKYRRPPHELEVTNCDFKISQGIVTFYLFCGK